MSSIKRLLNSSETENSVQYSQHREFRSQDSSDDDPILQQQTWNGLMGELFNSDAAPVTDLQDNDGFDQPQLQYDGINGLDEWTGQDSGADPMDISGEPSPPPPSSPSPSPSQPTAPIEESVCYGMIHRSAVKLHGVMVELVNKMRETGDTQAPGHCIMETTRSNEEVCVVFTDGTVFGHLNTQHTEIFRNLPELELTSFEVLANISSAIETIHKSTTANEAVVRVDINMYGPRSAAKDIGKYLSNKKIYLQRPNYVRDGTSYENPHFLKLPNVKARGPGFSRLQNASGNEVTSDVDREEELRETIGEVYAKLTRNRDLHGFEGDGRLKTTLLPHQKKALEFMIQRESGSFPEQFRLWKPYEIEGQQCYRHVVTRAIVRSQPAELGGGILADEMGMGKSLSIISLILKTLLDAHVWSHEDASAAESAAVKPRSRGTLIIASSALMIGEWIEELGKHLNDQLRDELKILKYHGQSREREVSSLREYDIVITTYHTLAADNSPNSKRNALNEIEWFRVVLDEAHIIRRQGTYLNKTVSQLWAKYRWCLTGTPIQNRLEDIGSLFAFLRLIPFERLSVFRRFIAAPYEEGGERKTIAIQAFAQMLDSVCLRRTKDLLQLPEKQDRTRTIDFTPEERAQYEQMKNMMFRAIRHQPGVYDRKGTLGMFQAQLQLRILCNHGTYQDPFQWTRRSLLEEREFAASSEYLETTCSSCKQSMPIIGSNAVYRKWTENCAHVLCMECIDESTEDHGDSLLRCPLCHPIWNSTEIPVADTAHMIKNRKNGEIDSYFRPNGFSSKMERLIKDVREDVGNHDQNKGIIFSCWTRTLNLIQSYLTDAGIPFERIDGDCQLHKRQTILHSFARDPDLRILIMTTGTGAVGLNLTSANRVFIVEPQWNPSVENQAIARALRLGQEHSVLVTRYVINDTVEQDMRSLQDVKRGIANLAVATRN